MTTRESKKKPQEGLASEGVKALNERLTMMGMRPTSQRILIAEVFFSTPGHVDVDQLLKRVRGKDPNIGSATVYRTMRLLAQLGLASERHFGDGRAVYEPSTRRHHHDHMICEQCTSIIEFENDEIEKLQDKIAGDHGFKITRHRLELYGICKKCRESQLSRKPPFAPVDI
jgi:Fur family ferric uptake transcriptional regulator